MEALHAIEKMTAYAKEYGADQFDILAGESQSSGLSVFQQKIQNLELSANRGIGIRIFQGNQPGYAYTESFTEDALKQTVKDAWSHTNLTGGIDLDLPHQNLKHQEAPSSLHQFNPAINDLSMDAMKDFCMELEQATLDAHEQIINVPYLGYSKNSSMTYFANHHELDIRQERNSCQVGLGAVAQKGDISKLGVESKSGRTPADFDRQIMSKIAVERAIELLDAEPVSHGNYKVLLNNRVSGQLMSMFQSPFFADSIQKGQSKLQGKLGESIASSILTLTNQPWESSLPGSEFFDGEGIATQPITIIQDGQLQSFLYNLETAYKDGVQSNGCASRGYSGKVGTSFANYVVSPGSESRQEILNAEERVLEIVKLEGGSGCSAISGEISIGAQGFLIENGQRVQAVDRITLSTNYFDLINNIEKVSSEFNEGFSSVRVPDLLINSVSVAG